MTELLAAPDGRAHVLSGLGGTGKSTVALQVAEAAVGQGRRVWWVSAADAASLAAGMLLLAESLGADERHVLAARSGQVPACDVLWPLLESSSGWLLVIDNADDVAELAVPGRALADGNGWVRGSRSGLLLVTSRDSDPAHWGRRAEMHPVGWLTDADGGLVLRDLAPGAGTVADAESLSGRLGGLALALHHAGSHLALPFSRLRTFAAYQRAWEDGDSSASMSDREAVARTWELSLGQLEDSDVPQARGLLGVLAWLAATIPVPTDDLDHDILGRVCGGIGAAGVASGLQALLSAGLISTRAPSHEPGKAVVGRSGIVVHTLVAETLREWHQAHDTAASSAAIAVDLLAEATHHLEDTKASDWPTWLAWLPHLEGLLANASACLEVEALSQLAQITSEGSAALSWAGMFSTSLKIAETGTRNCERLGAEHQDYLGLLGMLAAAHYFLGNPAESERLNRELLPVRERVVGPEHPNTLTTRYEIARAVANQGGHPEAERLYRELLPISERVLSPEHPNTLNTRYGIARAVAEQGGYPEAERLYRELLPIRERVLGPEHPNTLNTRHGIARAVANQGGHSEAERLYRELLPINERVLGPEHPSTLNTRHRIARAIANQGGYPEAERLYRELLPIGERVRGPEHPDTLNTRHGIARAVANQGGYSEAERLYRELLPIRVRVLGSEHPDTLNTRHRIARAVANQGGHSEAERLYRELLPIEERVRGPEHPRTLNTRHRIARAVADQGGHSEAERLYRELLPIEERVRGPEHPSTVRTRQALQQFRCYRDQPRG